MKTKWIVYLVIAWIAYGAISAYYKDKTGNTF